MSPNSSPLEAGVVDALSGAAYSSAASDASDVLLGLTTPGAEFVGILESRTTKESVVRRLDLQKYYKARYLEDACKDLDGDTHILENVKSGQIAITVTAKSPILASKMVQAYVDELDRLVELDSTSEARREGIFLEGRLKEIKQNLDDETEALSRFATKNATLDISSQGKAMIDSSLKLQDELASARSEVAGLRQEYSNDSLRVRAASARVDELQRQLNLINGQSAKGDLTTDTAESALPSISDLPSLEVTYTDLTRRITADEMVWETLNKQYELAKVEEAKEIPVVRLLDPPSIPERKSSPIRRVIVMSGALLSLLIAFISVNLANSWETRDSEDEWKKLILDASCVIARVRRRLMKLLRTRRFASRCDPDGQLE